MKIKDYFITDNEEAWGNALDIGDYFVFGFNTTRGLNNDKGRNVGGYNRVSTKLYGSAHSSKLGKKSATK